MESTKNRNSVKIILIILTTVAIFGIFVANNALGGFFKEDPVNYVSTFDIYEKVSDKDGNTTTVFAKVSIQIPYEFKDEISEQAFKIQTMDIIRNTPQEVIDSKDGLNTLKDSIKDTINLPEEITRNSIEVYISDFASGRNAQIAKENAEKNPNANKRQVIMENLFSGLKKNK